MSSTIKRENFVRLAEGRTKVALDAIRKLGNLSNRHAYEFSEADVKKIARALRDATSELEKRFGAPIDPVDAFKL